MTKAPVCPETGKPMVRDTRPMTITYKGQSSTFAMPGWYCNESDESIHTGEDMSVSDAALKALKIKVENLLPPEEVKRIRVKMGLTQRQAGAIIGGGPNDRIWCAFIDSINDPPRYVVHYHGGKTTFVHPDNFYWDGKPDSTSDCVWMVPRI